jgi:D-alanine-D-alanine ligase
VGSLYCWQKEINYLLDANRNPDHETKHYLGMKENIAIVAGGDSSEFEISYQSANQLLRVLDKNKFHGYLVSIRHGIWELQHPEFGSIPVDKNDFTCQTPGGKLDFQCVLMAIHGTPGEDGRLQAYFDMMKIPYTSSGVLASSLTFNKYFCKAFLNSFGIHTAKSMLLRRDSLLQTEKILSELGLPLFVKPNNGGSSFGVTKVTEVDGVEKAVHEAFKEDHEVILEEFLSGDELTCGVMKTAGEEYLFPITEIVSKKDFFDYDAKYLGEADEITPARVSDDIHQLVHETSSFIYDALNCRGIVRIDYIYSRGKLFFLEVNTVPGMTKNSIVPQQIEAAGLDAGDIISLAIRDAIQRQTV